MRHHPLLLLLFFTLGYGGFFTACGGKTAGGIKRLPLKANTAVNNEISETTIAQDETAEKVNLTDREKIELNKLLNTFAVGSWLMHGPWYQGGNGILNFNEDNIVSFVFYLSNLGFYETLEGEDSDGDNDEVISDEDRKYLWQKHLTGIIKKYFNVENIDLSKLEWYDSGVGGDPPLYKVKELEKLDKNSYIIYCDCFIYGTMSEANLPFEPEVLEYNSEALKKEDRALVREDVKLYVNKVTEKGRERYCFVKAEYFE